AFGGRRRSRPFVFASGAGPRTPGDAHALDRRRVKEKYLGGLDRLRALAPAAVVAAVEELQTAADAPGAPQQIDGIAGFIERHERLPRDPDAWYGRPIRARQRV